MHLTEKSTLISQCSAGIKYSHKTSPEEQDSACASPERAPMHTSKNSSGNAEEEAAEGEDETDNHNNHTNSRLRFRGETHLSRLDLLLILFSVFLFPYDIATDIYLAYVYYRGSWWTEFTLTVTFILLPSLVTAIFRLCRNLDQGGISPSRHLLDFLATLLQLTPFLASLEYLWYSINAYYFGRLSTLFFFWRSRARKQVDPDHNWYTRRIIWLLANIAVMRLIESFVEAIPQITVQLYIAFNQLGDPNGPMGGEISWSVLQSVGTSLASCSWSICFAYIAFVSGSPITEEKNEPFFGIILMLIGYFFILTSRFFSLVFLLVTSLTWFLVFCSIHWIGVFVALLIDKFVIHKQSEANFSFLSDILANVALAFSFIFLHAYIVRKRFGIKFWASHGILLVENVAINSLCFFFGKPTFGFNISLLNGFYVIILPQLVFISGVLCLKWQNARWAGTESGTETEVDGGCGVEYEKRERLLATKEIINLLGMPEKPAKIAVGDTKN